MKQLRSLLWWTFISAQIIGLTARVRALEKKLVESKSTLKISTPNFGYLPVEPVTPEGCECDHLTVCLMPIFCTRPWEHHPNKECPIRLSLEPEAMRQSVNL